MDSELGWKLDELLGPGSGTRSSVTQSALAMCAMRWYWGQYSENNIFITDLEGVHPQKLCR